MNRVNRRFISSEYGVFAAHVQTHWACAGGLWQAHEPITKGIYRRYLGLSCIAQILTEASMRNAYVRALPEAAYLGIVLALRSCQSTCSVVLRQTIELALRHIYFETHPVEYSWAQKRDGYREMDFVALMEYLKKTDEVEALPGSAQLLATISDWYARLSRYAHLHNGSYMGFPGINQPQTDVDLSLLRNASESLWPQLIVLLAVFQPDCFVKASAAEQRLVRDALSTPLKRAVASYFRRISLS